MKSQPFLVLVRTEDGIKNIKELRGKKCSLKPTQDMEILFLNTLLLENQQPEYTTFFSERLNPKNTNTGMMDVFFEVIQFVAVNSQFLIILD